MTPPVRSIRIPVWVVMALDETDRLVVFKHTRRQFVYRTKKQALAEWGKPVSRAMLVLDPLKSKKRRAKR